MRDSEEILVWLLRNCIKQSSVAKELNISRPAVSRWVWNKSNSRRIYKYFSEAGCPEELLSCKK